MSAPTVTDHPSALVSVPVEPTEAMLAAASPINGRRVWSAMLAAAPAAPQAAGVGELVADLNVLATCDDMEVSHSGGDTNVGDVARRCLNHLRAPSREPEGGAVTRAMESLRFVAKMESSTDRMASVTVANWIIQDIATREEAPAEAGEDDGDLPWPNTALANALHKHFSDLHGLDNEEASEEVYGVLDVINALRSQPQAREDAQPVSCQSCGGEVQGWVCQGCDLTFCERDGRLIAEHPALDALREAVGPIAGCLTAFPYDPDEGDAEEVEITLTRKEVKTICALAGLDPVTGEPLAALQAEQGAK